MKRSLLLLFAIFSIVFFYYSCSKDSKSNQLIPEEITIETILEKTLESNPTMKMTKTLSTRDNVPVSMDTPCFPQDIPSGYFCSTNHVTATRTLNAKNVPGLGIRPACSDMQVEYDVTICYNPNGAPPYQYYFYNFTADIGNCTALANWYNNLSNSDKAEQQDIWEYELSITEELSVVQAVSQFFNTNCPERFATSTFINEICYNRCLITSEVFPYFRSVKAKCGGQCCLRTRDACKGLSGAVLFSEPTFTTEGDDCPSEPAACKPNSIPLTRSCGVACGAKG